MWEWVAVAWAQHADEAPKACFNCEDWNAPRAPFPIRGSTWYVGPGGLSVVAVRTDAGVALFDGALPQSVPAIEENLRALGASIDDVRLIFVSHAHFDHAGGVAALQRRSGATVVATPRAASALRTGGADPTDPQAAYGAEAMAFPAVTGPVREVADGERVALGATTFEVWHTPGHTPGGASYRWTACGSDGSCAPVLYADSLNPVSADGYRFSGDPAALEAFEESIARVRAADCGHLVPVHPGFSDLFARAARAARRGAEDIPVGPGSCRAYAADAARRLTARLREEGR